MEAHIGDGQVARRVDREAGRRVKLASGSGRGVEEGNGAIASPGTDGFCGVVGSGGSDLANARIAVGDENDPVASTKDRMVGETGADCRRRLHIPH